MRATAAERISVGIQSEDTTQGPLLLFIEPAPADIYTLSLHDALPIWAGRTRSTWRAAWCASPRRTWGSRIHGPDRKSTRLNSSHPSISYAVFCLKKKKESFAIPFQLFAAPHVHDPPLPLASAFLLHAP